MAGAMFVQGQDQASMSLVMGPSSTSPGHSSPESFEVDDDNNPAQSAHWQMHGQTSPNSTSQPPRAPAPLQKRRRVTRACDECRRKKIKCDGKIPCTHCTVYSYGMRSQNILGIWNVPLNLTDILQTVRTTNPQTGEGTLHRNISKLWRLGFKEQKHFSGRSFQT
jgi:hypothetical protein